MKNLPLENNWNKQNTYQLDFYFIKDRHTSLEYNNNFKFTQLLLEFSQILKKKLKIY